MITSDTIFRLVIVAAVAGTAAWLREPPAPKAHVSLTGPVAQILMEHQAATAPRAPLSAIPK